MKCMKSKRRKRILSLALAGIVALQSVDMQAIAASSSVQTEQIQIEETQIGSQVWETPTIPDAPKVLAGTGTSEISLNETTGDGTWQFLFDIPDYTQPGGVPFPTEENQDFDFQKWEERDWQPIKVPGEALMQGFDILTNNEYYYKREITVPEDFAGKRVLVRFDGVYCNARVWIDGEYIKTHVGGFTTWDCDITEYVKPGEIVTMVVGVTDLYSDVKGIWNPEGNFVENPSDAPDYAHHNIGGINRDVSLVALPYDCIDRLYVNTDFDETFTDANMEVTAQLGLVSDKAELTVELVDQKQVVVQATVPFDKEDGAKKITIPVTQPKHWDAEHPNLYTLRTTLTVDGTMVQVNEENVGFREIHYDGREGTDANKVYVNGKEVKLRGTCRHDVSDDLGRSMTREECYAEIQAYKKANINFIRTSHYPASEDLLDACDELGIYVEQETAVCFQGWPRVSSKYEDYLSQFTEMVERDRNRPSILIWSLGNESDYSAVASQSGGNAIWDEWEYLKDVEPSRPCIFSWPDTGEPYEMSDLYSKHYADVTGDLGSQDRPALHDEYAHVACYNLNELQRDINVRNFWGESIKMAWENIFTSDGALGGALWGGIDDVFYIPEGTTERWQSHSDGQTAGYGEWGSVLDAYLREKPEAYLTKKAYSPIRINEDECYISAGTLVIPVKNWFDHTNLNELQLEVTIGDATEKMQVIENIAPHGEGKIQVSGIPNDAKTVNLKFYTADGLMTDEFNIQVAQIFRSFTPASQEAPEIAESDQEIRMSGEDYQVTFSKETGLISSASYQNAALLNGGPYLHVTGMDLGDWIPDGECPILATIEGNYAQVILKGSYENGQGVTFTLKISGNGIITTNYMLTTAPSWGEGFSEVGVSYDISKDMVSVSWLRDGLYTAYPEEHIGRNEGEAQKVREGADENPDQYGVEPQWSWKDDMKNYFVYATDDPNNGLVTNDFKTMRENVWYYHVNYGEQGDAPRISVESAQADVAARVEVSYDKGYVDDRDASITYTGSWDTFDSESDYAGTETFSSQLGDACEFTFYGTGIRYIGSRQENTGRVKIYMDGELQEEVDTYNNLGDQMKQSVIYSVQGLQKGTHTIRLETSGGNASCIVVDAFEVLNERDSSETEKAKLIINNQWYYPNLEWGNYTGRQGRLWQGMEDSVTIRLCNESNYTEEAVTSLESVEISEDGNNSLKAEYYLQNDDGNAQVKLEWYQVAEGDPDSKAGILEETGECLDTTRLKANKIYCVATLMRDGQEGQSVKSNEIEVGADSYTYYDVTDDSDLFAFEGEWGMDYKTDRNEYWTENAYEKTVTYLLDRENPASVSFTFQGAGIRWIGAKENNQGIAEVVIDEEAPVEIDLYDSDVASGSQTSEVLFERVWDELGEHTITIRRTGKKNEASQGRTISVDAFLVIDGGSRQEQSVVVQAEKTILKLGENVQAKVVVTPEEPEQTSILWSSSDEKVARVDESGQITAVGEGTADIAATLESGASGSIRIYVMENAELEEAIKRAEEARKEAEAARAAAEAAKEAAMKAKEEAEAMKNAAQTAAQEAEEAKKAAEEAKEQAGADSEAAKAAQAVAEQKAQEAEEAQKAAEEAQKAAQEAQTEAETVKAQAERILEQARALSKEAELKVQEAEGAKAQAEAERLAAEAAKKQAEAERLAAEAAKKEAQKAAEEAAKAAKAALEEWNKKQAESEKEPEIQVKKTAIKSAKSKKKRELLVSWKKQKDVSGYEIQYSRSKTFKNADVKKVGAKKKSVKLRKLAGKKTYYVRIRAYRKTDNGVVYGAYSNVLRSKIK